jgi:hypothetical protein
MRITHHYRIWQVLLLAIATGQATIAQQIPTLEDLTAAEFSALERVSEGSVTGTISFLASDELGGRGTPSKELTIATAYVASRLRAAGAEGLGPEGSFYIESTLDTVQNATRGCKVSVAQVEIATNVLEGVQKNSDGDAKPYVYSGKVVRPDAEGKLPADYSGPVIFELGDSEGDGPAASFQLRRAIRQLAASGATAVLVEAPAGNELWNLAQQLQDEPRVDSARSRFGLPIVLIEPNAIAADQEVALAIPVNVYSTATVRNVAGVLRGSDPALAKQAMLFSAHLDHLGAGAPGADPIYNGADDDASGVTAVLTLADAYGALAPASKRSLIFVTFWGEEKGLLGSKEFVSDSPWPLEDIVANINIEMIGRPENGALNKCWMTGWTESDLGRVVAQGSRRLGVETFEHPKYSAQLYRASDNFSFVQKGVVAHSFSAGSLHADYHQPSDEWQTLNLPHMTQVIRGLYAGTLPIAQGEVTPAKTE